MLRLGHQKYGQICDLLPPLKAQKPESWSIGMPRWKYTLHRRIKWINIRPFPRLKYLDCKDHKYRNKQEHKCALRPGARLALRSRGEGLPYVGLAAFRELPPENSLDVIILIIVNKCRQSLLVGEIPKFIAILELWRFVPL